MTLAECIADLERRLAELQQENAGLREEVGRLKKELEEWKRGFRERGKRRSSHREGKKASGSGKRPGRKAGHQGASRPVPDSIDRTETHATPTCECGGTVEPTGEEDSTIVQDIPPVKVENVRHTAPVGKCRQCGKRVAAKLPGAVESGKSVALAQVGPNALAMAVGLRFKQRVPLNGICEFLDTWFGLKISPGGLSQMFDRWRLRSTANYGEIVQHVRSAAVVGADETVLRQDGLSGYAWLVRTDKASLFRIELSRGGWVILAMLGEGFAGVVCSDFYGVYTSHDDWLHGYCSAHTIREAKKIAEVNPSAITEAFATRLNALYAAGKEAQASGDPAARHSVRIRFGQLVADTTLGENPDVARLQARIHEHFHGVLRFLDRPDVPSDNNSTERDVRPLAVYRKVTGGTRSAEGSLTLAHWMSLVQTLHKNDLPLRDFVLDLHAAHYGARPPPSVFPVN